MKRWILVMLLLTGCGKSIYDPGFFEPWLTSFVAEGSARGVAVDARSIVIRFEDLEDRIAGRCTTQAGAAPLVRISPRYWQDMPSERREILLFHELGHCLLGRGHWSGNHVMSPTLLGSYQGQRGALLDELFSRNSAIYKSSTEPKNELDPDL